MAHEYLTNKEAKERILLVVVDYKSEKSDWTSVAILEEMEELAITCGGEVVDTMICRIQKPSAKTLIGDGKVHELEEMSKLKNVDTIIFSESLKGSQQRNIEEIVNTKTIDRTQLILDIFARHASTKEGKMQVELAQLEYLLPRLVGQGIELSRLGGGIGTLGPGETKLEVDRRQIGEKVTKLKKALKDVVSNRHLTRKKRKEKGIPTVTLVGYTNAGKSTLLNTLTDAEQKTKDGLFTTLDSLSRQFTLPNHQKIIVSDTVGFMHDLPHDLIEAFKATLEEVQEADLLIHVIDVSSPNFRQLLESVNDVLQELKSIEKLTLLVFNKIDRLDDQQWLKNLQENYKHAVCISALKGINKEELLNKIIELLSSLFVEINTDIPINRMDLVNLAHKEGEVLSIKYYNDRINIRVTLPTHLVGKFENIKK